jgi:HEAT repeat protein
MRKLVYLALTALLVIVLGLVVWQALRPRKPEPTIKGKPVSFWVRKIGDGSVGAPVEDWAALGSNGVPYLARALERRNSPVEKLYIGLWPHLPLVVRERLRRPVNARDVRAGAAGVLGSWPGGGKLAIPALLRALKDEDWIVRADVAAALTYIGRANPEVGSDSPEVVLALAAALRDQNGEVRRNALRGLYSFGQRAKPAVPALLEALQNPDAAVRVLSARTLLRIDPETVSQASVLPLLLKSLTDNDRVARWAAIEALAEVQNEAATVVPAIAERLQQDPDPDVRLVAARCLSQLGRQAQAAAPALLSALKDKDSRVRDRAAATLKKIDPEAAANAGVK